MRYIPDGNSCAMLKISCKHFSNFRHNSPSPKIEIQIFSCENCVVWDSNSRFKDCYSQLQLETKDDFSHIKSSSSDLIQTPKAAFRSSN
ncbi:hypothetical protein YC2023_053525 [Brassica napus]